MYHILLIIFLLVAISLVMLIILQQGTDIDNSFGLGASKTLFGSRGSSSFITRMTAFIAAIFFCSA